MEEILGSLERYLDELFETARKHIDFCHFVFVEENRNSSDFLNISVNSKF